MQEIIRTIPLDFYVMFCSMLFIIGIVGLLVRKNALVLLMCIEIMLNAVNLLLVATAAYRSDPSGQVFVFFVMAVAAAEVSVGLAIIVMVFRNLRSVDIDVLSKLRG